MINDKVLTEQIGKNIRSLRLEAGLTQQRLGKMMEVSFQQIQKYETGANRISAAKLWRMAQVLDISVSAFFEGLDKRQKPKLSRCS